jgi:hypothetical protein
MTRIRFDGYTLGSALSAPPTGTPRFNASLQRDDRRRSDRWMPEHTAEVERAQGGLDILYGSDQDAGVQYKAADCYADARTFLTTAQDRRPPCAAASALRARSSSAAQDGDLDQPPPAAPTAAALPCGSPGHGRRARSDDPTRSRSGPRAHATHRSTSWSGHRWSISFPQDRARDRSLQETQGPSGSFMGGTGLEPVTPSLSSPQDSCSPFASIGAFYRVCSGFIGFGAAAFARVAAGFRVLLLAPVSTARRCAGSKKR